MDCRHKFSVTAGTPMHCSHLPLRTWAHGIYLIVASRKGISAMKLREMTEITPLSGKEGIAPHGPSGP